MEIRKVRTEEELYAVGRLRYDVTVKEMNLEMVNADHQNQTVIEPLDETGHVFAAWESDRVVATFRTNFLRESDVGFYHQAYDISRLLTNIPIDELAVTTRLAVAKEYRGSMLTIRVASAAYEFCLLNGITHDIIDSRAPYSKMFERVGYRLHKDALIHPEFGHVTVLALSLRDEQYLKDVRSPFFRILNLHLGNLKIEAEETTGMLVSPDKAKARTPYCSLMATALR